MSAVQDLGPAPLIWMPNGNGMLVRVRDPNWHERELRRRQAEEAAKAETAQPKEMSDAEFDRITAPYRAGILRGIFPGCPAPKRMILSSANSAIAKIAQKHGFTVSDLKGCSRRVRVVHARQEAMYVLRIVHKLSFPTIARMMGGKDHTTILHGVRCHEDRMARAGADADG